MIACRIKAGFYGDLDWKGTIYWYRARYLAIARRYLVQYCAKYRYRTVPVLTYALELDPHTNSNSKLHTSTNNNNQLRHTSHPSIASKFNFRHPTLDAPHQLSHPFLLYKSNLLALIITIKEIPFIIFDHSSPTEQYADLIPGRSEPC